MNLGKLSAERLSLKNKKKTLNAEIKALDSLLAENEQNIIEQMGDAGLSKVAIDGYTVSVVKEVLPTLDDFDAFMGYVEETGNRSLIYRRVNSAAFKEILASGDNVPGVGSLERLKVNARKT